jgi:hypothetical protein
MKPGPLIRSRTLVTRRWKLTLFHGEPEGLLFDLDNDPLERQNLWNHSKYRSTRAELLEQLLRQTTASDPITLPRWIGA